MIKVLAVIAFIGSHLSLFAAVLIVEDGSLILPNESSIREIDVNSDGINDFVIGGTQVAGSSFVTLSSNKYYAFPATFPDLGGSPAPLAEGALIGAALPSGSAWLNTDVNDGFVEESDIGTSFTILTLCLSSGCSGNFYGGMHPLRAMLGFEFQAQDGVHYGYFDLSFPAFSYGGYVNGWAYETEPNKTIRAQFVPEPSSALLLGWAISIILGVRTKSRIQ